MNAPDPASHIEPSVPPRSPAGSLQHKTALRSRAAVQAAKAVVRAGVASASDERQRGLARRAVVMLLERSVYVRHKRLALQRLVRAIELDAEIPEELWHYCIDVATNSRDDEVRTLLALALRRTRGRCERQDDARAG